MKKILLLKPVLSLMFLLVILASCSKEKQFANRLSGTWYVTELSGKTFEDGVEKDDYKWNNLGTISFGKNGKGELTLLGASKEFTWSATTTHIEIDSIGKMEIIKNEKLDQVWTKDETTIEDGKEIREILTMILRKQF